MKRFFFLIALALTIVVVTGCTRSTSRPAAPAAVTILPAETGTAAISDGTYVLDPAGTTVNWTGKKKILVDWIDRGTIAASEGTAVISEGAIASGSVTMDMTTIAVKTTAGGKDRGQDGLSRHLKSADFFDVAKYPTATFVFTKSTPNSDGSITVFGDMTIKGITKPVSFPANLTGGEQIITLRGSITLDRTLWDIKFRSGKFFSDLGDQVIDDFFTLDLVLTGKKK